MSIPESELPPAPPPEEGAMSAAREMSLHMLRMLETRMDAAGIAIQGETQLLLARLQLKLFAAAAIFIAIWGGIVLLAIALPPHLRVPVLSLVVVAFVGLGVAAQLLARKKASSNEIGSLHWFLDSLRQDLEVLSRALARPAPRTPPNPYMSQSNPPPDTPPMDPPPSDRSAQNDLAA
jgi:uncharacterized membrane protein YqjE